jgi:cell division protein FtsW
MRLAKNQKPTGVQRRAHRPDYSLVVLSSMLIALGMIVVYAITPALVEQSKLFDKNHGQLYFLVKQLLAAGLGIVAFVITSKINLNIWKKLRYPLLGISVLLGIAVLFTGDINGASRWIQLGPLSFQPVEAIKFALIINVAWFLAERKDKAELGSFNKTMKPYLIAMGSMAVLVAGLQSDLGSTVVMLAIMFFCLYIVGAQLKRIMLITTVIVALAATAVAITPYRRARVFTFLNSSTVCQSQNEGYHACQALIAIGSGGIFGVKLGNSVQSYGYLPEPANDSIFAVISENFGMIGAVSMIVVYGLLLKKILNIAASSPDMYYRLIVSGVFAWLFVQFMINVGAMVGLLPLKGITLPFVSYGGTSTVFVMGGLGMVLNASRYTETRLARKSVA